MALAAILKKLLLGRAFGTERGRIRLFGRMDWILYPARAYAVNLQTIGEDKGRGYLRKLGYDAGHDAAKEMVKFMGLIPRGGWATQQAVVTLLDFIGFGQIEFVKMRVRKDGHHHLILRLRNNPVTEHSVALYGNKSMACEWFMGVYDAHGEMELGMKNPHFVENQCIRKGAPCCEWESKW